MTIREMLLDACSRRGDAVALRYKKDRSWHTISYEQLLDRVRRVSELLGRLRVGPGDHVGIHLSNCPEWPEIYFGIVCMGATAVPVDAQLREQEVAHVLRNSGAKAVFASSRTYQVLRDAEAHLPQLEAAVLVEGDAVRPHPSDRVRYEVFEEAVEAASKAAAGQDSVFDRNSPKPGDVASIIYTSGTTGRQKGAMLTHANFCSNVTASLEAIEVFDTDNFLLVLPLHHAFAFTTNLLIPVASGAEISLIESLRTLGENVKEVSPTILIGVPLLTEKMFNRIWSGLKRNRLAYAMFRMGIRRPVIRGIKNGLGGRLRLFIVGGAPSDPRVLKGFSSLGLPVIEGYGLTETSPVLSFNPESAPKPGTVGRPIGGVEVRIDSPDAEGIGEIVARGPGIMQGYYNNPEATAQVIRDGWFHTGDLGFIDDEGYIHITGRAKNLIVNREGKNIYPEEVEGELMASPYFLEILVLGYEVPGETGERVGAIVVPNQEALDDYASERGPMSDEDVRVLITNEVKDAAARIANYKRPRRIQIRTEEFEKTSTAKVKRYLYAIDATEV